MSIPSKWSSSLSFLRSRGDGHSGASAQDLSALARSGSRSSVESIAAAMRHALTGCNLSTSKAATLVRRIDTASSAQVLWQLRPEIYELIALDFSQTEAQRRVNELLPLFEGWIPARQLQAV